MYKIMKKLSAILNKGVMYLLSRMTPSCEIITFKISQSLDHPLPLLDRMRVNIHLLGCKLCERYRSQLLAMHEMLTSYSQEDLPTTEFISLDDEARRRMKKVLNDSL